MIHLYVHKADFILLCLENFADKIRLALVLRTSLQYFFLCIDVQTKTPCRHTLDLGDATCTPLYVNVFLIIQV